MFIIIIIIVIIIITTTTTVAVVVDGLEVGYLPRKKLFHVLVCLLLQTHEVIERCLWAQASHSYSYPYLTRTRSQLMLARSVPCSRSCTDDASGLSAYLKKVVTIIKTVETRQCDSVCLVCKS